MKARAVAFAVILGVCGTAHATPKVYWVDYKSKLLNLQVSVPSDWEPVKTPKMIAFRYEDLVGGTAGVGILKSSQIGNIDEAAEMELNTPGHPLDWTRSKAAIGGRRAIKITGSDGKDASKRFVHYYVETSSGVYIVQCQGTAERWSTFSPIFATILKKLTFF
jgi:hypothetical protein